jgi:hypothetical protein
MLDKWFPKIEAPDGARSLTKQGAIGILLFAGMNLLGVLFAVYAGKSPTDQSAIDAQEVQDYVVGNVILLPLLLFFAYRVYTGKGWFVGGLTLAWFIAEIGLKIAGGSTNIGWIIFYFFVVVGMVNGIRGCWWLRKRDKLENVVSES